MPDIELYLKSLPPKNHPSFAPPCCPKLERMYNNIFTNPEVKFDKNTGCFQFRNKKAAQFYRLSVIGGQDWKPSLEITDTQLVLIKNPAYDESLLPFFGEKNGITMIRDYLVAVRSVIPSMIGISRPVRQSHLPDSSTALISQFQKYASQFQGISTT